MAGVTGRKQNQGQVRLFNVARWTSLRFCRAFSCLANPWPTARRISSVSCWITVADGARRHRALTLWAMPRTTAYYIKLPIEEQAGRLACGAGHVGSCAEYLHKTVHTLHELGIHDTYLWRLQHLVAEEIRRMQTAKDKGASK